MTETNRRGATRRDFLKTSVGTTAAAWAASDMRGVHAAEDNTIRLALVGCGGRGTGAVDNALGGNTGPLKLVAMADVFDNRLKGSSEQLAKKWGAKPEKFDVADDRKFVGLDAYRKAMDCLKPGDVVILATPPAFRWVHFRYAIDKGLNVFMEKPVTVDGPTTVRMLQLAEESVKKNLKCGVGLMVRHCRGRRELYDRIHNGEIGDIIAMRAYRLEGQSCTTGPKPAKTSELMFQIQRFHSFLWSGGGMFSDFNIHQIDECSWMKDAWPVKAHAVGGRHYRGNNVDQNFDSYSVEYTYPDGTKFFFIGRGMPNCHNEFASYAHGAKGTAVISTAAHAPGRVRTFNRQNFAKDDMIWAYPQPERSPYVLEWEDLIEAIRQDKPYNEVKRGAEASLVTSMGRMAAHTGQVITFEQMLKCPHEFAPNLDTLTADSPAPLQADATGRYPVPQPGLLKDREYAS